MLAGAAQRLPLLLALLLCTAGPVGPAIAAAATGATVVQVSLPAGTALRAVLSSGQEVRGTEGGQLSLSAGELIKQLVVELPAGYFFLEDGARLRGVAAAAAAAGGECGALPVLGAEAVDVPLSDPQGLLTKTMTGDGNLITLPVGAGGLAFRSGGTYRLCYSYDGSFAAGATDTVRVDVAVQGVLAACAGLGCLAQRPFYCYAVPGQQGALGACAAHLPGVTGDFQLANVSWSARFSQQYSGIGLALPVSPAVCGQAPPDEDVFCEIGSNCSWVDAAVQLQSAQAVQLPRAGPLVLAQDTATVAICYCSGIHGCATYASYVQQVGIVYLFATTAAPPSDTMCASSYAGVLTNVPFAVCVRCPPGACLYAVPGGKLRLMEQPDVLFEEPTWSPRHGCHGARSTAHLTPSGPASEDQDGGGRADYKRFAPAGAAGFLLAAWAAAEPLGTGLQVCFCLGNCSGGAAAWFKVGQLAVVAPRLATASTVPALGPSSAPPRQVAQPGRLALNVALRAYGNPSSVLGLDQGGGLRLLVFDRSMDTSMADTCARLGATQALGFSTSDTPNYRATVRGDRLVFDGGTVSRALTVGSVGVIAVCYCATLNREGSSCMEPVWAAVGAVMVAGPTPYQWWTLPTNRIVRFEYRGAGLAGSDRLRIVRPGQRCEDAPPPLELCPPRINVGLPSEEVVPICGHVDAVQYGDLATLTLTDTTVGCDEKNVNCLPKMLLKKAVALDSGLRLRFAAAPRAPGGLGDLGLADGDVLVLGNGVLCGEGSCSEQVLNQVRGIGQFAGLEAYFDFNGPGVVVDRVGTRSGTLMGAASVQPGYLNEGILLPSDADAFMVDEGDGFDAASAWTLMLWARAENIGRRTLCGLASSDRSFEAMEVEVGFTAAGELFLEQQGTVLVTDPQMGSTDNVDFPEEWQHVAVVYGGTLNGELLFYLNGTLAYMRTGVRLNATNLPLTCGGRVADAGRTMVAGSLELDEVRWYNIPLSAADVAAIAGALDPESDGELRAGAELGNRIIRASTGDPREFEMPGLSWPTAPVFQMGPTDLGVNVFGSTWRRTNRGVTAAEILTPNQQYAKVCWERNGYFAEAGTIQFQQGTLLMEVGVYITTEEWLKTAPFVLTFQTADAGSYTGQRYGAAQGSVVLQLLFLHMEMFDLQSSILDDTLGYDAPAGVTPLNEQDPPTQILCGQIFKELWSDDPDSGFPLPLGCQMRGIADKVREVTVVFEPRNGLNGGYNYHMVMNAWATNFFDVGKEMIMINIGDDVDTLRYSNFQVGHAYANKGFQIGAAENDPRFADEDGIEVVGGNGGPLLDLREPRGFSMHFRGGTYSTAMIKRGCQLNLFLWPLTAWRLPTRCADYNDPVISEPAFRILCDVVVGTFRKCGAITSCLGVPLIPNQPHVSRMYILLPSNMNDLYGTLVFRLTLSQLAVPDGGFMPSRLQAQVTKSDNSKPNYVLTTGHYLGVRTLTTSMVSRLLYDSSIYLPFTGDQSYLLYVKLILPTGIRGAVPAPPALFPKAASTIVIRAPAGFTVLGISPPPSNLGQAMLTPDGDAASALSQVQPAAAPTGFGWPDASGWSFGSGQYCTYTLPPELFIAAGSSLMMGVTVRPKNTSLLVSDPANEWQATVVSPGESNSSTMNYTKVFYRTGLGGVPELDVLTGVLVQPSDPTISIRGAAPVSNVLSVFFRTNLPVPANGFVDVEAPADFDFGVQCLAGDLDDAYYVLGLPTALYRLPTIAGCLGVVAPGADGSVGVRSIARLHVTGPLEASYRYGLRLRVFNSANLTAPAASGPVWRVATRAPSGEQISASQDPAPGVFGGTTSFQLRGSLLPALPSLAAAAALADATPGIAIGLASTMPSQFTQATVLFRLRSDATGELRIAAPQGFEWLGRSAVSRPGVPWENASSSAYQEMPGSFTSLANVLLCSGPAFAGGTRYGFRAPLYVPAFLPVASVQAFFVEIAAAGAGGRGTGVAAVVPAPPVRVLVDALVRATDRLPGALTGLLLQIRLATEIADPGALFVQAPVGFKAGAASCMVKPWPGKAAWDTGEAAGYSSCAWAGSLLTVRPGAGRPLPAGLLQFMVQARNPLTQVVVASNATDTGNQGSCLSMCWTFGSYNVSNLLPPLLAVSPTVPVIDAPLTIAGLPIPREAVQMGLLAFNPLGRDDRPLRQNVLAFTFRLAKVATPPQPALPVGYLELAGPYGFTFDPQCYSRVETRLSSIFKGAQQMAVQTWGISEWEPSAQIIDCKGTDEVALIAINAGLFAYKTYVFAIAVQNPEVVAPTWNWTMAFQDYFSKPFASFDLWTFTQMRVSPLAAMAGPSCYRGQCIGAGYGLAVPVTVTFRVLNTIATNGELQITMPLDFGFQPTPGAAPVGRDKRTPCILREYRSGNLSGAPDLFLDKDRDCLIAYRGNPLDGSGTGDTRTMRLVMRFTFNEVDPSPPRQLVRSSLYQLVVYALHPPGLRLASAWLLASYNSYGDEQDRGSTGGYALNQVFRQLSQNNVGGYNLITNMIVPVRYEGLALIPGFAFDLALAEDAQTSDQFVITGPPGFLLQRPGAAPWAPGSCIAGKVLRPLAAAQSRYDAVAPAICSGEVMVLPLTNFAADVQSLDLIRLQLELPNPEKRPLAEKNYWKLEHVSGSSGDLLSSALVPSWIVVPSLVGAAALVVGGSSVAGGVATISISFRTVTAASELVLAALAPVLPLGYRGFDFSRAFARAVVSGRSSVPQIQSTVGQALQLGLLLAAYDNASVTIQGVVLPEQGGTTTWNLTTYSRLDAVTPPELQDGAVFDGFSITPRPRSTTSRPTTTSRATTTTSSTRSSTTPVNDANYSAGGTGDGSSSSGTPSGATDDSGGLAVPFIIGRTAGALRVSLQPVALVVAATALLSTAGTSAR